MKYIGFLFAFFIIISCSEDLPLAPNIPLTKIEIENGAFKNGDGTAFFPWGFNYTNPDGVALIEDNWLQPAVWETIKEDFIEMKELGANVIRLHLQYHQFIREDETKNQAAFDRLKELVSYAQEQSLYLDITGLAAYRMSDQPASYTNVIDAHRWAKQKLFWRSIAEELNSNPAVFAYNLMNEPVVSVGCDTDPDCAWTPGSGLGGFHFVQNITRTPGIPVSATLKEWISVLIEEIRIEDLETPITVGFLPLGNFKQYEDDLDFLSPHIYPVSGEIDEAVTKILSNQSNVPLIIEETANFNCTIEELDIFLKAIEGKYQGLMGHYHGKTISELNDGSIVSALRKNFYEYFRDNNPN